FFKRTAPSSSSLFPYTTLFRSFFPLKVLDGLPGQIQCHLVIQRQLFTAGCPLPVEKDIFLAEHPVEKSRRRLIQIFLQIFVQPLDRKSTRLNSSHVSISYAVFF